MSTPPDDVRLMERLHDASRRLEEELAKVVVGQRDALRHLLLAVLARGHCLLIGVPGLAKTLMIRTLAESMELSFNRIQFTPDLMPSDVTGTDVLYEDRAAGTREFRFLQGPLFANVVLADEVNRTPPKTQAALLEAMQERQVTVGGKRYPLPDPFFVLATQNPIEQEGTYPLPEAQLDRFMFSVWIDYPTRDEELEIVRRTTDDRDTAVSPVLSAQEIVDFQRLVRRAPIADHVAQAALDLARRTRPQDSAAPDYVKEFVEWGAGPRASQHLVLAAKALALVRGRPFVDEQDVRDAALPVLRHRVKTGFHADAEGVTAADIVAKLLGESSDLKGAARAAAARVRSA